jgi:hypothetical protein
MMRLQFTNVVLKLGTCLLLLFAAAVGLTRAQPYDDSMLRAMLTTSDSCTLPCWQGIEPGVTSVHDALIALERSEWVGEVTREGFDYGFDYRYTWWWNRNLPGWGRREPQYLLGSDAGKAYTLSMPNVAQLWQLWLIFGVPDTFGVAFVEDGKILSVANYEQLQVHILTITDCTAQSASELWHGDSQLEIGLLGRDLVESTFIVPGTMWRYFLRRTATC